jgi:hypothetical protein
METSGNNIVNLGSDKLNINTTTAKGLEKAIGKIAQFIIKSQDKSNKIIYGDIRKKYSKRPNTKGDVNSALSNGLIPIVDLIASIDLCNVINYALQQIPGAKPFDPNQKPSSDNPLIRAKWELQYKAYQVQILIDKYNNIYPDSNNIMSRTGLSELVNQIVLSFQEVITVSSQEGVLNPELQKEFPELSVVNNFLENVIGFFNKYTNVQEIPIEDVKKILSYIDKTRNICIAIQGLNSPATAINFLDSTFNVGIQEQIAKIQKIIDPKKIIPLISSTLKTANNINAIGRKILGFINSARSIIKIVILLLKIFKIVIKFLKAVPVPLAFLTLGISLLVSDTLQQKINKFVDTLIDRLSQINLVLDLVSIFVTNLLIAINYIIEKLKIMLLNLQACSNIDDQLIKDTEDTINDLSNTRDSLQLFLDNYNNNSKKANNNFGDYTIQIVTEEITDEGISLKRRYGIGINKYGNKVVESTPTFASLDQIIINEVKVLLVSKGFVDADLQSLSSEEISTITQSLNYLEDGDINIQDLESSLNSVSIPESVDSEIELNSFIDNLSGGKALRKRVRKQMIKQNEQLTKDLKQSDPNGTYTNSIIKEKETNKLKIEELQDQKKKLLATLAITGASPIIVAATIKKIKDIDDQIKKLKNS